jgi:hypothetical protein
MHADRHPELPVTERIELPSMGPAAHVRVTFVGPPPAPPAPEPADEEPRDASLGARLRAALQDWWR